MAKGDDSRLWPLGIFDMVNDWVQHRDFEGLLIHQVFLEGRQTVITCVSRDRTSAEHPRTSRRPGLGSRCGRRFDDFSCEWHILMRSSSVPAGEGDKFAARHAHGMSRVLLAAPPSVDHLQLHGGYAV